MRGVDGRQQEQDPILQAARRRLDGGGWELYRDLRGL